ncbi:MAG: hypothetical protein DRG39_02105 [Deltaproteobacteria bacterium]|nr:MAG: hypothetical protein DRG39_02105 [Deltaproteobacteria bacterium]
MQDIALERRVDRLEEAMMELVYQSRKTEMKIASLAQEMKEFKDEMKEFKDEMKEFKDEMKEFKDEMRKFKEEAEKDRKQATREWNKKWGELANKLGTIVEDLISPAIGPVIRKYFHCEPEQIAIRIKKRKKDLRDEFDAVAICEDKVFLFEVKATPRPEYVFEFIKEKVDRFKKLFPELLDKRLYLIFASIRLEKDIINLLTKHKIFGMAYREWEYMDILNFDEVVKQLPE